MATSAKIVKVFDKIVETYEHQTQMLNLVDFLPMDGADAQNSASGTGDGANVPHDFSQGVVWRPIQQHSAIQEGYDLTGLETDIIEETVPCLLGTPKSDWFKQRADSMRDTRYWERRGEQAGMQLATTLNRDVSVAIETQGSLYYETAAANGYDAIGIGQTMLNEREKNKEFDRFCVLSDRANLKYAGDLAARGTLTNRPEDAYADGMIGKNVAGFDVYTGSYTGTQAASTGSEAVTGLEGAALTSTGDSFIPDAGSVDSVTGIVTNVDYRIGTFTVASSAGFVVGDKVELTNVNAVAMADKSDTGQLMTFTVVAITGTSISVYPKPITVDLTDADGVKQTLYRAYANVTGTLVGATINAINVAGGRSNLFGAKNAIQVNGGTLPANLLSEFEGLKIIYDRMDNGQEIYFGYSGNLGSLDFRCRAFTIYGITVMDASGCGSFTAQ